MKDAVESMTKLSCEADVVGEILAVETDQKNKNKNKTHKRTGEKATPKAIMPGPLGTLYNLPEAVEWSGPRHSSGRPDQDSVFSLLGKSWKLPTSAKKIYQEKPSSA
ncbi:2-Oxoglutarate Dehydrogenase [Manis pentadactyla]|nr:2-Oxoglutarate Dehydrogenase [Manis pentadactyla]